MQAARGAAAAWCSVSSSWSAKRISTILSNASRNACTQRGSNCVPLQRMISSRDASDRERRPVRPVRRHRVERVGQHEDARADRDLVRREALRVALAVEPLVVRHDDDRRARTGSRCP